MKKFAVVFPGQGSQSVGMLNELAQRYAVVTETFAQASEVLGYDLWALVQKGPEEDLNQTHCTQPALLASSVAIWRVWQHLELPQPSILAGHSLGEYSALVCAGVLDFSEAIKLVQSRGQYMQQAVAQGTGAMYAILGLTDEQISQVCQDVMQASAMENKVVAPVNFNSPGQVVIAGHKEAAELAANRCKELGAKRALPLSVSVPSHCALMQPAADLLAKDLENTALQSPQIAVVNNVDVAQPEDVVAIKNALVRQLYCPVRWTEVVEHIHAQGIDTLYEFGPGKVLTGLAKRINKSVVCTAVNDLASADAVLNELTGVNE